MNRRFMALTLGLASLMTTLALWSPTMSAQQDGQRVGPSFYVVNMEEVLRNYTRFKQARDAMKTDIESKKKEFEQLETQVKAKLQQRGTLKDKADINAIDKDINDLKFEAAKREREYTEAFAKREAQLFNVHYKEVTDLIGAYCKQNKILLVLRISSDVADISDPTSIGRMIGREVVYFHPNLDITQQVIQGLNEAVATRDTGAARPAGN